MICLESLREHTRKTLLLVLLTYSLGAEWVPLLRTPEGVSLAMACEKPKDSVISENNFHINVKGAGKDGPVVRFFN